MSVLRLADEAQGPVRAGERAAKLDVLCLLACSDLGVVGEKLLHFASWHRAAKLVSEL